MSLTAEDGGEVVHDAATRSHIPFGVGAGAGKAGAVGGTVHGVGQRHGQHDDDRGRGTQPRAAWHAGRRRADDEQVQPGYGCIGLGRDHLRRTA